MPKSCYFTLIVAVVISAVCVQARPNVTSTSKPVDLVLEQAKKWLSRTPPFRNSTSDEEMSKSIVDLLSWTAPEYVTKHFPYYLSGLSDEKLPIYIVECGKYDFVELIHQGPEMVDNMETFFVQAIVRGLKHLDDSGLDEKDRRVYFILDFEGFSYSQYTSPTAIALLTRLATFFIGMAEHFVEKIYVINGNFAVDLLYSLGRPIFGQFAERIEMYGPNKAKWQAVLKREFSREALPAWYGGSDDFKPIAIYG